MESQTFGGTKYPKRTAERQTCTFDFFFLFSPANIIDCAKYCYVFNHVLLYVVDGASEDVEDCLGMTDQVLLQVDQKLQFS